MTITIIERLTRKARQSPAVLYVTEDQVQPLVEAIQSVRLYRGPSDEEIEKSIRSGKHKFLGIPLRVST